MATHSPVDAVERVQRGGDRFVTRPEFEWLARAGLGARGVVYGVVGILALELALGAGGRATNQQGALATLAHQPLGTGLLVVTAVGLAGYAIWRLTRAAVGHGAQESDSALQRVAGLASGLAYAGLCVTAISILIGAGGGSSRPKQTTGGILGWPGGPVIVGIIGVVLVGVGLYQGYKGLSRSFLRSSQTGRMSRRGERVFTAVGVVGHLARMVVFALIGYGLISAAINFAPRRAIGLDGALRTLAHSADGPVLLGIVAAGLIAFALYSIADARYRKV
ncbi:MAG: DUF1206 domain-containing protein [Solirubrobacteraceae bacterium]